MVSPLASKYANNHSEEIHTNVHKAMTAYNNIRNKVRRTQGDSNNKTQIKKYPE